MGDQKQNPTLPLPPTPSFAASTQYENPIVVGMCQQGTDLCHQPLPPLYWPGFVVRPSMASYRFGLTQFQYPPKASHKGTSHITICLSLDPDTLLS